MTGFIQRLLSRGTGQNTQAHQVTLRPRPRSRFETTTSSFNFDSETQVDMGANDELTRSELEMPTQQNLQPPHQKPARTEPTESLETFSASDIESENDLASNTVDQTDVTIQPHDLTSKAQPGRPQKNSLESKTKSPIPDSVDDVLKETHQSMENIHASSPTPEPEQSREQTPEKKSQPQKTQESSITNLFKVIEEHNSGVLSEEKPQPAEQQVESPFEDKPKEQNKNDPEHKESTESLRSKPSEVPVMFPVENQPEQEGFQEGKATSGVTISIGQIQVEFTQPEVRAVQSPKPTIHRTQGFDGYARARRGYRR